MKKVMKIVLAVMLMMVMFCIDFSSNYNGLYYAYCDDSRPVWAVHSAK